jgi:hypothetical protein
MTRLRDVLAAATLVVVVAGCGWMFPDRRPTSEAERVFSDVREDGACLPVIDSIRHVADVDDPADGPRHEWWTARTEDGGRSEIVVQFFADGGSSAMTHCLTADEADADLGWWGGMATESAVMQVGRAPTDAQEVILYFDPGVPVHLEVFGDGAFIEFVPVSPNTVGPIERIEALDADGRVIASLDL